MSTINPRKVVLQVLSDLPGEDVTTSLSSIEGQTERCHQRSVHIVLLFLFSLFLTGLLCAVSTSRFITETTSSNLCPLCISNLHRQDSKTCGNTLGTKLATSTTAHRNSLIPCNTASAAEVALILVVSAANRNSFVAGGAKSYFALTTFGMALMTMATCAVN